MDQVGSVGFSWRDLLAYLTFPPRDGAYAYVIENPPRDPATVMTTDRMRSVSDRIAKARESARAAGLKSHRVGHTNRKKKKKEPAEETETG